MWLKHYIQCRKYRSLIRPKPSTEKENKKSYKVHVLYDPIYRIPSKGTFYLGCMFEVSQYVLIKLFLDF